MIYRFSILFLLTSFLTYAQPSDTTKGTDDNKNFIVLPALYYSPETSLGFGGAGIFYFREAGNEHVNPSSIQSVFIYTLEGQIQFQNKYDFFIHNEDYWVNGELSYYIYPYEYYGVGSSILEEAVLYSANYLQLELNALKQVKPDFYLGPTLWLDHYFKIDIDSGSALDSKDVLGTDPSTLAGYGLSFILDKRNNVFSPYRGYYLEGRFLTFEDKLIGDFKFTDLYLDVRKYFHPFGKLETGLNFYHQTILGVPPFYNYALMGGSKLMRGYYKGAYRDSNQTVLQGEIRGYPFHGGFLDRIVLSVFGGVGAVSHDFMSFDKLLGSYGVGIRFELDAEEKLRVRFDYARGYKTDGFYININEAF